MWHRILVGLLAIAAVLAGVILLLRTAALLLFAAIVLYSLAAFLGLANPFLFTMVYQNIHIVIFLAVAIWLLTAIARSTFFLD